MAFGSGLAALDALLKLQSGDHVHVTTYGGQRLMERVYARLGLSFTFVDMRECGRGRSAPSPRPHG